MKRRKGDRNKPMYFEKSCLGKRVSKNDSSNNAIDKQTQIKLVFG